jgi:release factor glutamine methyltransferase
VLAHPEGILSAEQLSELEVSARRLEAGEPLPYLLGHWEFFGLDFIVTPAVLIPRPETELMVEQALSWLHAHFGTGDASACRAVDVGCGSGCVAIALVANFISLQVTAVDLSPQALEVAHRNVERHGLAGRVTLVQADLLPPQPPTFDLICANLPYIPSAKLDDLPVARWEPRAALDGGPDGLALIRRLLQQAAGRLVERSLAPAFGAGGGLLLLEIESSQGAAAALLARQAFSRWEEQGWKVQVAVLPDLAGLDRLVRVEISL